MYAFSTNSDTRCEKKLLPCIRHHFPKAVVTGKGCFTEMESNLIQLHNITQSPFS